MSIFVHPEPGLRDERARAYLLRLKGSQAIPSGWFRWVAAMYRVRSGL